MSKGIFPTICRTMEKGAVSEVKQLLQQHPEYITQSPECARVLNNAVLLRHAEMIRMMLEIGIDIDSSTGPGSGVLSTAVTQDDPEMLELLLALGANSSPDDKEQMLAINASLGSKQHSLEMLKLLHEYGCDLNETFYRMHDNSPMNALSMAMTYGKDDVVAFLKSIGCTLPEGIEEPT